MGSILCLFSHVNKKEDEVVTKNYESLKNNSNCRVVALQDEYTQPLENSWVCKEGMPIKRGSDVWHNDTIALNYILQNDIQETHIFLCDGKTRCEADLNVLFSKYFENDVTTPELMTRERNANWMHFKSISEDIPKYGLTTSLILIKKECLYKIAQYCKENWNVVGGTNDECRLGTVSKLLNFNVKEFDGLIARNIKWHDTKFYGQGLVYHPCNSTILEVSPDSFEHNIYAFYSGGAMGDQIATISSILYDYDILNENNENIYIDCDNQNLIRRAKEIFEIFETNKKLIFVDSSFHPSIPRQPLCPVQNHQFPYYKSKYSWKYSDNQQYDVCYQFTTSQQSAKYLPPKVISKEMENDILKMFEKTGLKAIELGLPNTLETDLMIILNSKMFVGIDSGMSHLCHVVGAPIFVKEFDKNIKKNEDWHFLDFFHGNKYYCSFYDTDELERKMECYKNLMPCQKQNWKNYGLFRMAWSDRFSLEYNINNGSKLTKQVDEVKEVKFTKRKIFIDGGCFNGDSIRNFLSMKHGDSQISPKTDVDEYEIYGFDGVEYFEWSKINHNKITMANKLLGTKNEIVKFHFNEYHDGNSVFNYNDSTNSLKVKNIEMIDLSKFISDNFSPIDYIILKLDVEGAEYDILEKMIEDKTIDYINELYVEFHTFAQKYDNHHQNLINRLKSHNILFKVWY